MSVPFSRSLRALGAEGANGSPAVLGVAAALLVGWLAWGVFGGVTVWAVTPTARVEVVAAAHPVTTLSAGQVQAVYIGLGQEVAKDEVLVELDRTEEERALEEALSRRASLEAQLVAIQAELDTARGLVGTERASGTAAVEEVEARVAEADARALLAEEQLARISSLAVGAQVSEAELANARGAATSARAAANALRRSVSREGLERRGAAGDREAQVAELERGAAVIAGERTTLDATVLRLLASVDRRFVRAPIGGTIAEMSSLAPGAFLDEGAAVATIVPEGKLKIVAQFPPQESLGRVRVGQGAAMRLDGFPWTWYGTVPAQVSAVGDEVGPDGVRVELTPTDPDSSTIKLQHGLPGAIEIAVERVSPLVLILRAAGGVLGPRTDE